MFSTEQACPLFLPGHWLAYNLQVWSECRNHAVAFLDEVAQRLPEIKSALVPARQAFRNVADSLNQAAKLFPWDSANWDARLRDATLVKEVAAHIRAARAAEEKGLAALATVEPSI